MPAAGTALNAQHGTARRYRQGCHDKCCRAAQNAYERGELKVDEVVVTKSSPERKPVKKLPTDTWPAKP